MDERKYTYIVQWAVAIASALLFLLLIAGWFHELGNNEWRKVQKEYRTLLEGEDTERGILQVELPALNRTDRCISCHNGIEDIRMSDARQPHEKHPGTLLEAHPVKEYGCTVCHGGQGPALNREDAFGQESGAHWPHPLLEQPYIQSSCGRCHLAIFDQSLQRDSASITGMEVFVKGKQLFSSEGCLGCHKARDVGGILGPDLTRQGEKTRHEYSFQNIAGEQSVSHWLKEHFKDPEMVSPGSQMLQIQLEEQDMDALATFVMGLAKPDIPVDYFTLSTLSEFKGVRDSLSGSTSFAYLCSACHGKEGEGKDYEEYKTGIASIGNPDFLRTASKDFIRFTVEKGRSLRQMGSWSPSVSGMKDGELDALAYWLDNKSNGVTHGFSGRIRGEASRGEELFDQYCAACHGENGAGDVALALNQEGFLHRANKSFILQTLLNGRANTAMPHWSNLEEQDVEDLVEAISGWSDRAAPTVRVILPEPDLEAGALRYHFLCHRCHGDHGEGDTGPAIINADFLEAADNAFLLNTIAEGRNHTAMFGWSADVYGAEKLDRQEISNIIGFMKASAEAELEYIFPGSNPGDRDKGKLLFKQYCAECHGPAGEGSKAPALANQEFLSAASNGYLLSTMTLGRTGTDMPSWGYDSKDYSTLSGTQRQDLVAHLRTWQRIRIKY